MPLPFIFCPDSEQHLDDTVVAELDDRLKSKRELLDSLASQLQFPDYFGRNWDALNDCLRSLDWINQRRIVLHHKALPMPGIPSDQKTYLEILKSSVEDWQRPSQDHELVASFSAGFEGAVRALLRSC
jgi:hypothetical protein